MNSIFALKLDVLYSANGRLRLRMHFKPTTLRDVHSIRGVQDVVYNERIGTLLIIYKADDIGEEELIMRIASGMARQTDAEIIRIVREDGKAYSIPYSGALSLGCIITDALLTLSRSALSKYTHWLSLLTTLGAIFEHGYSELRDRGSFDPEVMSIVYLLNSVPKGGSLAACALAWTITFGRHMIPKGKQIQDYVVRKKGGKRILTPIRQDVSGVSYAERVLGHAAQSLIR